MSQEQNTTAPSTMTFFAATDSKTVHHTFTCANPACGKGYNKKAFHCYNFDCCSNKCLTVCVTPIREEERRKAEERNKARGFDHIDFGTGGAAF